MFAPEFQLLLYCARSQPASGPIKRFVDQSAIDWGKLLALADQHCVRPLLLQSLKAVCWDAVPALVRLELERFCKSSAQKYLLLTGELATAPPLHGGAFVATIVTGCRACRDLDAPAPAELPYKARNSSAVPSRARCARSGMLLTASQRTSGSLSGSTPTTDSCTGSGPSRSF